MKTAVWLYLFLFVAFFDLHAQFPILSPFALSLGATPSFIGFVMGIYSITHIPGNLLAGYGVDRFGSKIFIFLSLTLAGLLLLFQATITNPWELLVIRSISGFVLAFLSPACLALLAKLASTPFEQGKLMAGNGLVHTIASVASPAAGALLVAKIGFSSAFTILGWVLIATGIASLFGIRERAAAAMPVAPEAADSDLATHPTSTAPTTHHPTSAALATSAARATNRSNRSHVSFARQDDIVAIPWPIYGIPLALACSQGILFFELPLLQSSRDSLFSSGILFSIVSLGALVTLSMLFLNKYSPLLRTIVGAMWLSLTFFGMSVGWPLSLTASLFSIGMAKGVIFPALSTFLASSTDTRYYGKVFAILSIATSIGAFIGPILSGQLRGSVSPYFLAFVGLMIALIALPAGKWRLSTLPGK